MTAPVMVPCPPDAPAGHDSFAHLLRAEWTKFRTVRGWVIAAVAAMLVTMATGVLTGLNSQEGCPGGPCHPFIPTGPGGEAVTDTFYFVHRPLTADGSITVHRPLTADGSITVRVTSLTGVIE